MSNEKNANAILKVNLEKKESTNKFKEFQNGIFTLFYYILQKPFNNFWWECISLLIQYFQLSLFIIDSTFFPILSQNVLLKKVSDISYYIHFILFFDNNLNIFLSVIYIYLIFLIFILCLIFMTCFKFMNAEYVPLWPITILKYSLPIISKTFFGQIFLIFLSIFKCLYGKKLYYAAEKECIIGTWYYITLPFCCIGIIIQIVLSYVSISLYYQADFSVDNNGDNFLRKNNPISDIILLFNKIIIIIIFMFDQGVTEENWPILFVLCITTGFNAYTTIFWQNYGNEIIKKLNYFSSLFLFYGFLSLFIGNIFKGINFSGGFYLFLSGSILIFIFCMFFIKTNLQFLKLDYSEIKDIYECLNYINTFVKLINEKETSRDSSLILESVITKVEEKCTNKKCFLKKYNQSLKQGFESNFLLLLHVQKLFKTAINKLQQDIMLKIHYIIFLTKINQKKNAQKELSKITTYHILLYNKFNIFRCKKYLEENSSISTNSQMQIENDNNDIFQEIEYKNNYKIFLNLLSKSSSLYYEFWNSLYTSHIQGTEDFRKLNDIGGELNTIIEEIEKIFGKMREIKNNDLSIIKLYESYLKNILNNQEKYEKYHKISMNLITDNRLDLTEKDFTNLDLKSFNNTDEYQFLIISANDDNKGTILNMSLNTCLYFGYTKDEIIGKDMCILIPEIYHKIQKKLFNEKTEKIKTEFFEKLSNKVMYTPEFMEFSGFGKNKLKYLIPLNLKIVFAQTEESDLVYIMDINKKNYIENENNNHSNNNDIIGENKNSICCVLTDNNLIIQTFTANCVEILDLDSKMINANYDITNYIAQFNEELQNLISASNKEISLYDQSEIVSNENSMRDLILVGDSNINNNDISLENKLKLKKKLLKQKYYSPKKILWKMNNSTIGRKSQQPDNLKVTNFGKSTYVGGGENSKKKFLVQVKEEYISNVQIGYYFYFKKIVSQKKDKNIIINASESNKVKLESSMSSMQNLPKINKSSVKFLDDDEEERANSSRIYNDEDTRNNLSISSFRTDIKKLEKNEKRSSSASIDIENLVHVHKHESAKILSDFKDEAKDIIDENFVPQCNFNFFLDLETNSFKSTNTFEITKKIDQNLRNQALNKINIVYQLKKKERKKNSSDSDNTSKDDNSKSDDLETDSYIASSSESSSRKSSKKKDQDKDKGKNNIDKIGENNTLIKDNENNNKNIKKSNNIENEYYKVSMNDIKFMIYDFMQEMVISSKCEKKSQVEIIINNYKSRQSINISEDINYVSLSFEKYLKDIKSKNEKNSSKVLTKKSILKNTSESHKIIDTEKEFENEITYSLTKQDEQKSIVLFYQISFLFLLLIIILSSILIYYIINKYSDFKENLNIIIYSISLKYHTNIGIFSIREMSLYSVQNPLANLSYSVPDISEDNYITTIYNISKNCFTQCNSLMEKIIAINLKLSDDTENKLFNEKFNITVLYDSNKLRNVTSTIVVSLIQVYSSFCNLLKNQYISLADSNLYNFMHNSLNQISIAIEIQIDLYIKEINNRKNEIIAIIIIFSIINLIIHILLYVIILKFFFAISNKKTSYISVFYAIGINLIKSSMKKCEFFINTINMNEKNEALNKMEEDESSLMSLSNNNINSKLNNKGKKENSRLKKNKGICVDKRTKQFKKILSIALIISFLIFIAILISLLLLVEKFIISADYLNYLQHYHNNIIELYNGFREFIYDENQTISNIRIYDYLIKTETLFYNTSTFDIINIYAIQPKITGLSKAYEELSEKGFCSSYITKFASKEECETFMGGTDGIMKFGFLLVFSSFVEDIRYARNIFKVFLDNHIIVDNFSFYDNEDYLKRIYEKLQSNSTFMSRITAYNTETFSRITIYFTNIVMQYMLKERDITIKGITEFVNNGHIIYIIFIAVYMAIFIFIFFIYWIPMIRTLNKEIFKTKNMLSILPVQILASLPNIRELLNISNKIN